ncbi:MAG: molybdopterin-binding protein [Spirochaetaceae bacterium]|jgi:molybdopterin biosynthesis enzyme|nr:molybdopterin-binding protein [Spirochaetaceae bacterium]
MKTVNVEDAVGHVLCHDLTRIVHGQTKRAEFRKGHIVKAEDIPMLLSMGKQKLYVWEKQEGFLHEDEAAAALDSICRGKNVESSGPVEGKIEQFSMIDGLLRVDVPRLLAINSIDGIVIATRRNRTPVKKGELLAAMKAVPLVIAGEKIERARALGDTPLVNVLSYTVKTAAIVITGSEVSSGIIADTFTPVLTGKLERYGIEVIARETAGDGAENIAKAVRRARLKRPGMILCTGGMSVDPDDNTPGAISKVAVEDGGRVITYGAPVMPGAMFMLACLKDGLPVLGLPGCVMYAGITIFDAVLPIIAAKDLPLKEDFIEWAHGGLCLAGKGCAPPCRYPNCTFLSSSSVSCS